jgi:hypothetical protein
MNAATLMKGVRNPRGGVIDQGKGVIRSWFMELPVILNSGEDGYIVAQCSVIPGCASAKGAREGRPFTTFGRQSSCAWKAGRTKAGTGTPPRLEP